MTPTALSNLSLEPKVSWITWTSPFRMSKKQHGGQNINYSCNRPSSGKRGDYGIKQTDKLQNGRCRRIGILKAEIEEKLHRKIPE